MNANDIINNGKKSVLISLPPEIIGSIESFLSHSNVAQLSATGTFFKLRWPGHRWRHHFYLVQSSSNNNNNNANIHQCDSKSSSSITASTTPTATGYCTCCTTHAPSSCSAARFNISALGPSLPSIAAMFRDCIERIFLGYHSRRIHNFYGTRRIKNFIPSHWGYPGNLSKFKSIVALSRAPETSLMSPWKLACLLKEKGVECIQCPLCKEIDIVNRVVVEQEWCSPCLCPKLVHRRCLEMRLGSKRVWGSDATTNTTTNKKTWISYDDPEILIDEDELNGAKYYSVKCRCCRRRYKRGVRLPTFSELISASLDDPLCLIRILSTGLHFAAVCFVIAYIEGFCKADDDYCADHYQFKTYYPSIIFKWPRQGSYILAWWVFQECCLLHVFLSPRFIAIVDHIAIMNPIAAFYSKLLVTLVLMDGFLAFTFVPCIGRFVIKYCLSIIFPNNLISFFRPLVHFIAYINLSVYAISSTMIIFIFWRTHYRVFTIADYRQKTNRNELTTSERWSSHPLYQGWWQILGGTLGVVAA